MAVSFSIPCELTITAGGQIAQKRLRLDVFGETVFDDYEASLTAEERQVVGEIAAAHARVLGKYSHHLRSDAQDAGTTR